MEVQFVPVKREHLRRLNKIVNDPEVARFITLTPPVPMSSTLQFYRTCKEGRSPWWAIIYKGKIVGSVSLLRQAQMRHKKMGHIAELGIAIDRPYWKMGLGKKAIKYALNEARRFRLKRVQLFFIRANSRAGLLYSHCGFKKEGVMKRYFRAGKKYYDAVMMSKWLD